MTQPGFDASDGFGHARQGLAKIQRSRAAESDFIERLAKTSE
jgi:hypothetical protein